MLSVERLSSLIGSIYDCVLEPDRWPFALTEICAALRFANGSIGVNALPSGETLLVASVGIPPYWLGRMSGYGDEIMRLWGGVARVREYPFEEPVVCSQATDRATWTNNTWFTEWAAPQGLLDAVSIPLVRDETMLGTLTLARHQSVGPVDDTDLATLRLLAPHVRRAVTIGRCFDLKTVEASTFAAVIDALTVAVILVDAQLGIVYANPAATTMLETGGVIGRSNNALRLAATLPMEALRTAVACAAADELTLGRRGIGVPLRRADGAALVAHVLPLRRRQFRADLVQRAAAAVFVTPSMSPPALPGDALALLYDLTPAELRVFELIANGTTQPEIAHRLGIAPSTVKTHLLRVFAKTGCGRQADLIKLAASMALPLV